MATFLSSGTEAGFSDKCLLPFHIYVATFCALFGSHLGKIAIFPFVTFLSLLANHTGILLAIFVPFLLCYILAELIVLNGLQASLSDLTFLAYPFSFFFTPFREVSSFEIRCGSAGLSDQLSTHTEIESDGIVINTVLYRIANFYDTHLSSSSHLRLSWNCLSGTN